MKKLWQLLGKVAFWLSYPALAVYLRIGTRTRVLIVVDDEVLLVRGWLGSGEWQMPGGGVHHGEVPVDGALREIKEETGIVLTAAELTPIYSTVANYRGLRYRYTCFTAQLVKKPTLKKQALEITHLSWVPLKNVTKMNATDDTYQAVQTWLNQ